MWDILDTKLYTILSDPLYKSDSDSELKEAYKEFVERLTCIWMRKPTI